MRQFFWTARQRGSRSGALIERTPAAVALLLASISALPLSWGPSLWETEADAREFLGLLWQVTAGTLGVAVAALIFLYESYGSMARRRRILTPSEFATRSGVLNIVGWLIVSLLLTGAVLLGWGDEAPMGWAAFLALVVAVYALLSLPRAFSSAARLIGPDELHKLLHASIRPKVAEAAKRDLLTITMQKVVSDHLERIGAVRAFITPDTPVALIAPRSGLITDVDLNRLKDDLDSTPSALITFTLFSRIREGDALAHADGAMASRVASCLETISSPRIGRRWDEFTLMKNLELDGREALREGDSAGLESCLQLHEEVVRVLLAFEKEISISSWPSLAGNTDLLDSVRRNLLRLFFLAADLKNEQGARDIAGATVRLMHVAIDESDVRLASQFLAAVGNMVTAEVRAQ